MSKLSLRWRITLLMGALTFVTSVLLTVLSVYNATQSFMIPFTYFTPSVEENIRPDDGLKDSMLEFDKIPSNLPDGSFFQEEIDLDLEKASRSFSASGLLYLVLITIGSMGAAYWLAGKAMRPVSKLQDEIKQIDQNSLSLRVSVPETHDEIRALSLSFNDLLEHLENEFEREKRFSANIAHELKTPLSTMIASAQILKLEEDPTAEEYEETVDIALQNAKRISDIVDNLLMLHRAKRDFNTVPVNLDTVIFEIQKEMETIYPDKIIQMILTLKRHTINGDHRLLYQAFFNLIDNAYKYMPQNGTIEIVSYEDQKDVVLQISDTGIGISEEDLTHIFEPFYRADKSRSSKVAGSGLGLSITKEILDLHHAHISFHSILGEGTTVTLRFTV